MRKTTSAPDIKASHIGLVFGVNKPMEPELDYSVAVIAETVKVPKSLPQMISQGKDYKMVGFFPNCAVAMSALSINPPQIIMIYKHMAFWSTDRFIQASIHKGMTSQFILIGDEPDDPIQISDYQNRISGSVSCQDLSYETVFAALDQAAADWDAYNNPAWIMTEKNSDPSTLGEFLTDLANGVDAIKPDGTIEKLKDRLQMQGSCAWVLWGISTTKDLYINRKRFSDLLKAINYYLVRNYGGVCAILWKDVLCCFIESHAARDISMQYAHPLRSIAENINELLKKGGLPPFQFFADDKPAELDDFCQVCRRMEALQQYSFFDTDQTLVWPARLAELSKRRDVDILAQYTNNIANAVRDNDKTLLHEVFRQMEELIRQTMSFEVYAFARNSLVIQHFLIARNDSLPDEEQIPVPMSAVPERLSQSMTDMEKAFLLLSDRIKQKNASLNPILQRAIPYIKEHLGEKMSLEQVAEAAHASVYHVSRLFKSETGMTFTDYVHELRIEKSRQLLHSQISIQLISEQVGFDNAKYFSKVFRKKMGMSPKQYRETLTEKKEGGL